MSKFFEIACALLRVRHPRTTAYHPKANGQAERFNRTILIHLRDHVPEQQKDWDIFVQPSAYAYDTWAHRSTKEKPFSLVGSRHPPGPTLLQFGSALPIDRYAEISPPVLPWRLKACTRTLRAIADTNMASISQHYKRDYH